MFSGWVAGLPWQKAVPCEIWLRGELKAGHDLGRLWPHTACNSLSLMLKATLCVGSTAGLSLKSPSRSVLFPIDSFPGPQGLSGQAQVSQLTHSENKPRPYWPCLLLSPRLCPNLNIQVQESSGGS